MKSALIFTVVLMALASCDTNTNAAEAVDMVANAPKPEVKIIELKIADLATDKDLYCDMVVEEGYIADTATIDGKIYGFCSTECKEEVLKEPTKYLSKK